MVRKEQHALGNSFLTNDEMTSLRRTRRVSMPTLSLSSSFYSA